MPDYRAMRETTSLPRLARVEAIHVRVPFRRPLLDASGEYTHRRSWLLRLIDESGREGLGEALLDPFADEVALAALDRLVRSWISEIVAGRFPTAEELAAEGPAAGRAMMAGLEGALGALAASSARSGPAASDGRARAAGSAPKPGSAAPAISPERSPGGPSLEGRSTEGPARSVPVCAVIGFGGPDAGSDAAAQAVELGFRTLKIRAGYERTTEQLVDRVRAMRAAVGPEPRLRVDVGGAWTLDVAVERLAAIERFGIEFVEQPLPAFDLTGHAALRERVRVPVALDEAIEAEGAARAALMENAADFLVVKPARVGGEAAVRRIEREAKAAGVRLVLGTYFETGVGIAAVLRVAAGLGGGAAADGTDGIAHTVATAGLLAHDLLSSPLPIENGRMAVPGAISLDESEVARYTIERFEVARG